MNPTLERAQALKQELLDYTFDADGELAIALEKYSVERLAQLADSPYQGMHRNELVIDSFAIDGSVGSQSVLDLFLESRSDLSDQDRTIITRWQQGFMGLFSVTERATDHLVLMNWLTQKKYSVLIQPQDPNFARLKLKDIVLTRILPLRANWMFSGPAVFLGKLGKPKLAVAIGNFKIHHKAHLYGDAPDLLEDAWQSVESYHQSFVEYFGHSEITLPGHQLEKKLTDFQAHITQQQLAASGLDAEKSLKELADEAGVSQEEMSETAEAMGIDHKTASRLLENQKVSKMMMPTIELPKHLKSADQVTVLTHPRWGQVMISTYQKLITELETIGENSLPKSELLLVEQCLKSPEIKPFVWHQLAQQYPKQLEQALGQISNQPHLNLEQELDRMLVGFGHPLQPELPEIASVPMHLHNLFQEAMLALKPPKSKSKDREKPSKKVGFG